MGRGVCGRRSAHRRGPTASVYTAEETSWSRPAAGPRPPVIPGIEHVISSNEALDLPTLPKRIVIGRGRLYRGRVCRKSSTASAAKSSRSSGGKMCCAGGLTRTSRVYLGEEGCGGARPSTSAGNAQIGAYRPRADRGYVVTTTAGRPRSTPNLVMYATGPRAQYGRASGLVGARGRTHREWCDRRRRMAACRRRCRTSTRSAM